MRKLLIIASITVCSVFNVLSLGIANAAITPSDGSYQADEFDTSSTTPLVTTPPPTTSETPAEVQQQKKQELMRGIIPEATEEGEDICEGEGFKTRDGDSLGKKIKCGTVGLSDMPAQIVYWISFVLKLIPTLGVIMVLVAGLFYLYGAVSEGDREKAKNALIYVALGLIVSFSAWLMVDWIQTWLTVGAG